MTKAFKQSPLYSKFKKVTLMLRNMAATARKERFK